MFSKLFNWKKQEKEIDDLPVPGNANWAFLGADMHSHFIPGIDDGAKTIEDSLALLCAMKDMGYNTIITTPHVMIDYYPNTTKTIQSGLLTVQNALKENNIDITLKAAAEYYIDESFIRLLETEPLLTIFENQVLVECSMLYEPPMLLDVIFKMQSNGYRPVIAHPERYLFFHKEAAKYTLLKDRGCLFQLNMLSVSGYYGRNVKMIADELLRKGMYDYCGSDMHHEKHAAALKAMAGSKDYHTFTAYSFLNHRLCS
ncbi:MAG: tyrosine-protein phosphatase [Chitinophagales bacterium]